MPLLEVRGLQKTYSGRRVVDGVDFHVGHAEIVGLLGPNGAGKTTTFRMVMGMIRSEAGDVKCSGEDISTLPMYQRARRGMGYLAQEPSIFRNLTVEENILAILETQELNRAERQRRLQELLSDLGLSRVAQSLASTLSGGERRRLEIARALVTNPAILMLDEPFSGVDPKACADIQKIISSLRVRGMSILITDHNVFETFTIADRVYIIHDGRVLKHGTPEDLINDKQAQRLYLGDKFDEFGEAFQRLRKQIADRSQQAAAPRIGRTTRIIRLEEAEHRRKLSQEYYEQERRNRAGIVKVAGSPEAAAEPAAAEDVLAATTANAPSDASAPAPAADPAATPVVRDDSAETVADTGQLFQQMNGPVKPFALKEKAAPEASTEAGNANKSESAAEDGKPLSYEEQLRRNINERFSRNLRNPPDERK